MASAKRIQHQAISEPSRWLLNFKSLFHRALSSHKLVLGADALHTFFPQHWLALTGKSYSSKTSNRSRWNTAVALGHGECLLSSRVVQILPIPPLQ